MDTNEEPFPGNFNREWTPTFLTANEHQWTRMKITLIRVHSRPFVIRNPKPPSTSRFLASFSRNWTQTFLTANGH
jgi:hypothetical protein